METRTISGRTYNVVGTRQPGPSTSHYIQRIDYLQGQRGATFSYNIRRDGSWYLEDVNARIIAQGRQNTYWSETLQRMVTIPE